VVISAALTLEVVRPASRSRL